MCDTILEDQMDWWDSNRTRTPENMGIFDSAMFCVQHLSTVIQMLGEPTIVKDLPAEVTAWCGMEPGLAAGAFVEDLLALQNSMLISTDGHTLYRAQIIAEDQWMLWAWTPMRGSHIHPMVAILASHMYHLRHPPEEVRS